jgi:hypothetical protein
MLKNYTAYRKISYCEDYCNECVLEFRDNSFGRSRAHFSMEMLKTKKNFLLTSAVFMTPCISFFAV